MDDFLKENNNQMLHRYLLTYFALYKSVIEQMIILPPKYIEGYTPIQRLAFIINNQDSANIKKIFAIMKQIQTGNVTLTSKQFENLLLELSQVEPPFSEDSSEEEVIYF